VADAGTATDHARIAAYAQITMPKPSTPEAGTSARTSLVPFAGVGSARPWARRHDRTPSCPGCPRAEPGASGKKPGRPSKELGGPSSATRRAGKIARTAGLRTQLAEQKARAAKLFPGGPGSTVGRRPSELGGWSKKPGAWRSGHARSACFAGRP
jgi:hypothetical protein